jgi:hypothetical protein
LRSRIEITKALPRVSRKVGHWALFGSHRFVECPLGFCAIEKYAVSVVSWYVYPFDATYCGSKHENMWAIVGSGPRQLEAVSQQLWDEGASMNRPESWKWRMTCT